MVTNKDNASKYFKENWLEEIKVLNEFLKIKTISSDSAYLGDIHRGANWLADYFNNLGAVDTKILETDKHPVVYSQINGSNRNAPTVLLYGHYDVQPPDPIELWQSQPFEPEIREGNLYARGASDMKGQIIIALTAIKSIQKTGDLPVNFKFFIEGEEEIGSPSIKSFLEKHKDLFKSDFVLNLDAGLIAKDKPTIVYGLRGLAYFEIFIEGPKQDLHSGLFGGVVRNPIQALCELLDGMKNANGVIQLPGFYDDVAPLSKEERSSLEKLGMDDDFYKMHTGARLLHGETGFSPVERVGARPTLDINGIVSGYTGEGPKTVIPAKAMAKISMRLVPNQSPEKVKDQLVRYLSEKAPEDISWRVEELSKDPACITNLDFYAVRCFSEALESVWNIEPFYQRGGGSIPIVSYFKEILGLESVLSGFSLPEDNIHSPNEKLDLDMFKMGVETVIQFIYELAKHCGD
jgi:acetylornithine deacetylase/succinyl-diaminopimelate desuccinylase-like protein